MVLGAFDFPAPPASGGALVSGNTVKNNRIHNNGNEVNGLGGILLNAADFFDNGINPTVSDNTVKDNEIHGNARHGIWLSALVANNGKATISNNTIKGNDIESSTGWGVEILGNPGLPPFFVDGTVVDNTFRSNTFAGNGLGEIHWPAAAKVTALLRSTTWGVIKTQRPRVIAPVESDMGNVEDLLNRYGLDQLGR